MTEDEILALPEGAVLVITERWRYAPHHGREVVYRGNGFISSEGAEASSYKPSQGFWAAVELKSAREEASSIKYHQAEADYYTKITSLPRYES